MGYRARGYGRGHGRGYGRGYGRGHGFSGTDPTKCTRFPWLSRWWWANPDSQVPVDSEKEFLEGQITNLTQDLENLKRRLEELSKEEPQ